MWFFGRVRSPEASGSVKSLFAFWAGGAGSAGTVTDAGVRSLFAFWAGGGTSNAGAVSTEDPLGDYSLIPLFRRKKLEDELEEIELKLRDISIDIPLPGHSEPVIYNRPLLEPFSNKQQTISVLVSRRARAQAEYRKLLQAQQDDDDDSAILLLWP